jgi:hypothetical protein
LAQTETAFCSKSKRNRGRPGFDVGCKAAWRIPRTRNLDNQLEKK